MIRFVSFGMDRHDLFHFGWLVGLERLAFVLSVFMRRDGTAEWPELVSCSPPDDAVITFIFAWDRS